MGIEKETRLRSISNGIRDFAVLFSLLTLVISTHSANAEESYSIKVIQSTGGTVSPTNVTVNIGGSEAFTIAPDSGYSVAFVMVDGVSKGAITSYTFSNVTANHTISAVFTDGAPPPLSSSSINYFYDDLCRLVRSVTDTAGAIYQYDDVGNLVSTTIATTTGDPLSLTAVYPNALFVGTKTVVQITGSSLLTTDSLTAQQGLVSIANLTVTDSQITAEMTALAPGIETLTVTTRTGTPNTASLNLLLSSSQFSLSPGQLPMVPGGSGTVTARINPPLAIPFTTNLFSDAPSVATVLPSVTIPASGSATFTIDALQQGAATISAVGARTVVLVGPPFEGDVSGLTTGPVSVRVDTPPGGAASATSRGVAVHIDEPTSLPSALAARPVSVNVVQPADVPSVSVARPVSVNVTVLTGSSPINSGGVSAKIQ